MTFTEYDYPRIRKSIDSLRKEYISRTIQDSVCVDANALYDAIKALEQLADELEVKYYSVGAINRGHYSYEDD